MGDSNYYYNLAWESHVQVLGNKKSDFRYFLELVALSLWKWLESEEWDYEVLEVWIARLLRLEVKAWAKADYLLKIVWNYSSKICTSIHFFCRKRKILAFQNFFWNDHTFSCNKCLHDLNFLFSSTLVQNVWF